MSWATKYIKNLKAGETVQFRPKGNSMTPRIKSGQLCKVKPVDIIDLKTNDVVLCRVGGSDYLHIVTAIDNGRVQISNNKGHINGWTRTVYGKLIKVED